MDEQGSLEAFLNSVTLEDIKREKAERNLYEFVQQAWPILEPGTDFQGNWHLEAICQHLEAVNRGEVRRLLINVPPRTSKSTIVSVMWPLWSWIKNPALKWVYISYGHELSKGLSIKSRQLLQSDWFQRNWGHKIKLSDDQNEKHHFATTQSGFRYSTSSQGTLTGKGGDFIVVDDPHDPRGAESDTERRDTITWWRETASTRLDNPKTGAIVIIMQRLHSEDLSGYTLENEGHLYDHLNLPMRYEADRSAKTSIGFEDPRTEEGELLWSERFDETYLKELENKLGSYGTAGQLQQRPVPREGGMFRPSDFVRLDSLPAEPIRYIRAWDKAGTEGAGKRTAGVKIALLPSNPDGIRYAIVDVVSGQWSAGHREQVIKNTAHKDGHNTKIVIEKEPGSGGKESAENTIRNLEGFSIRAHAPTGDKEVRAEPLAAQVEIGAVAVLNREWTEKYLEEIGLFPNGKYLDQVDATAMGFNQLAREGARRTEEPIAAGIQVI